MYSSLEEALMINWLIVPLKDTLTPKMKKKTVITIWSWVKISSQQKSSGASQQNSVVAFS